MEKYNLQERTCVDIQSVIFIIVPFCVHFVLLAAAPRQWLVSTDICMCLQRLKGKMEKKENTA
jgi:hypothetical protein